MGIDKERINPMRDQVAPLTSSIAFRPKTRDETITIVYIVCDCLSILCAILRPNDFCEYPSTGKEKRHRSFCTVPSLMRCISRWESVNMQRMTRPRACCDPDSLFAFLLLGAPAF